MDECFNVIHEEVVTEAKSAMLPDSTLLSISNLFKVLGDPTRTRIVLALDQREMCVCDLTATLKMTISAISHQLNALRQNKIVKTRRDGKRIYYSLDDQHITDIIELAEAHMQH